MNCEHKLNWRQLIKPYCPRLLSVFNFTPSINKPIIFLCRSEGFVFISRNCVSRLFQTPCISSSLVNPLLMLTKKPTLFFCFYKAQIMRELYFECTWKPGSSTHIFVGLNLQIVMSCHVGIIQHKLLKRTQTVKFSRLSMWEGLSERLLPVLTLEDTTCWIDLCFLCFYF